MEDGFRLVQGYCCRRCGNHVSLHMDIVSKTFRSRNGRAFLFAHATNIKLGKAEDRVLRTGLHAIADIYCSDCNLVLGWKYNKAYHTSQKYKEGKFILEREKIDEENG